MLCKVTHCTGRMYVSPNLVSRPQREAREFITFGLDIITQSDTAICLKESYILLNFSCTHAMNARQGWRKATLGLYHTSGWHYCNQWGWEPEYETRLFYGSNLVWVVYLPPYLDAHPMSGFSHLSWLSNSSFHSCVLWVPDCIALRAGTNILATLFNCSSGTPLNSLTETCRQRFGSLL